MNKRIKELIKHYNLSPHDEGGYFKEGYYPKPLNNKRADYGNCLFLLPNKYIDFMHQLDVDEIWYFHEGCGMIIYTIDENNIVNKIYFGNDIKKGQVPYIVFKKGTIFGGENIDKKSYTFFTCLTLPKYTHSGFKIINKKEINNSIKIEDKFFKKR